MFSSDDEFSQIRIVDSNQQQNTNDSGLSISCDIRSDCNTKCNEVILRQKDTRYNTSPEYLAQLLSDKKKLQSFPGLFAHLEKLLDEEIGKVRRNLFHLIPSTLSKCLPNPIGPTVTLSEKLSVPIDEYPDYNFVGRILGPRGRTAKQLEQDMDCKIMIRGKGSTRNGCKMHKVYIFRTSTFLLVVAGATKREGQVPRVLKFLSANLLDASKSKQQEHQNEELHILITVEDAENRAKMKLQLAVEQVKKLLVPAPEGEDSLKKKQLMELAIINGTYRETRSASSPSSPLQKIINRSPLAIHSPSMGLLAPSPANATPIILTPARVPVSMSPNANSSMLNGCIQRASINGQPLISSGFLNGLDPQGGILVQFEPNIIHPTFIDLAYPLDSSQAGPLRRGKLNVRDQPYLR